MGELRQSGFNLRGMWMLQNILLSTPESWESKCGWSVFGGLRVMRVIDLHA